MPTEKGISHRMTLPNRFAPEKTNSAIFNQLTRIIRETINAAHLILLFK
ncbi:hypothetical protein XIS1_1700108 [Xenorhabdus innexi]|uniref:Uncharacterized protein n=1 Tax=Xenorhabdus innexi TaxID=290109 RepID=A0A1N6MW90_9GAMM|nr:hypothetical protein XIS1_1700108 [Xenorhabdus innexi]